MRPNMWTSCKLSHIQWKGTAADSLHHRNKLSKLLESDMGSGSTVWKEVEDSFVSNTVGGGGSGSASAATSRL